jgi:hypothetical protein
LNNEESNRSEQEGKLHRPGMDFFRWIIRIAFRLREESKGTQNLFKEKKKMKA